MYEIVGSYQGMAQEVIDTAETLEDATYLLEEYRVAFGEGWALSVRKKKGGSK